MKKLTAKQQEIYDKMTPEKWTTAAELQCRLDTLDALCHKHLVKFSTDKVNGVWQFLYCRKTQAELDARREWSG